MTEFLITRRETFEAVLIIAIVRWFLHKQGYTNFAKPIIIAVIAAIFGSILFAIGLHYLNHIAWLHGYDALFEGLMMIVTSLMLLHMISWMSKQQFLWSKKIDLPQANCASCPLIDESSSIKKSSTWSIRAMLEQASKHSVTQSGMVGIASLIFFAVLREGAETVLLLMSSSNITWAFSHLGFWWGIGVALLMGYAIYGLGMKFSLKYFFRVTSLLLVLFAAWMMTYGVHELEEFAVDNGYLQTSSITKAWNVFPIQTTIDDHQQYFYQRNEEKQVYYHHLHDKGSIGTFLKAFFGWNSDPNVLEPIIWILIFGFGMWILSPKRIHTL
jgi:high-affinity iron transporter